MSDHDVLDRAAAALRSRRYRVDVHDDSVAAERGYLREAGNLVFHISLLFVLLGVAIGVLFGFRGTSVVIVGQGFSNNLTQYDDFSAGARFTDADLVPFSVIVKDFDVKFETGPVQRGAARLFRADVEVTERPGRSTPSGDARGQQAAPHRRHHRAPDRPRLRPQGHRQGRPGQRRVLRSCRDAAAGRQLQLDRRDQGSGRSTGAARFRGVLLPDRGARRAGTAARSSRMPSTLRCS